VSFCYDIDISLCGLLVGEVNERLIVRAACTETNCLWAVSWPQSAYSRTLKQVRHFTAVDNWNLVLNVFGKLRYKHTRTHARTHTQPYIRIYIRYLTSINLHFSHILDRLNILRTAVIRTQLVGNSEYENKTQ
jgi:hypothetical protein